MFSSCQNTAGLRSRTHLLEIIVALGFFFTQDSDFILKKSVKVSDWNAKEVLSASLSLPEERRLNSPLSRFYYVSIYNVFAQENSSKMVQCCGMYPCFNRGLTVLALGLLGLEYSYLHEELWCELNPITTISDEMIGLETACIQLIEKKIIRKVPSCYFRKKRSI